MHRLESTLDRIDRKGYGAYKDLRGSYEFGEYTLYVDKVQRDSFAPPSLVRIRTHGNRFDPSLFENSVRRIAFEDFLAREVETAIRRVVGGAGAPAGAER